MEGKIQGYAQQADIALEYHHHFDIAVTLFQVAIALSAIACSPGDGSSGISAF